MSRLYHVNAFSHHPFGGNPAVVVLGKRGPTPSCRPWRRSSTL